MSRHDGVFDEKKDKAKPDVDPYVMIGKNLPSSIHMKSVFNATFHLTLDSQPDVDEVFVERTTTKSKVRDPEWNETFSTDLLRSAEEIGFTVFHRWGFKPIKLFSPTIKSSKTLMLCSATVPPDDFIANCKFPLADLIGKAEQPLHEIWVDLEPNGKLHVKIELLWATQDEQNQPNRAFQVIRH